MGRITDQNNKRIFDAKIAAYNAQGVKNMDDKTLGEAYLFAGG